MNVLYRLDQADNVAVTFHPLQQGQKVCFEDASLVLADDIPVGHKIALRAICKGQEVVKYGASIGQASADIVTGEWVHSHNLNTALQEKMDYRYTPVQHRPPAFSVANTPPLTVYKRAGGSVGIRNELWVIPTVGCVNHVAQSIVAGFRARGPHEGIDGVYGFSHPYGCSQLGDDHERTRIMLQNMALHPNAGGVLVLGLGCENNQIRRFHETLPESCDSGRILFLAAQSVQDEIEAGITMLEQLYQKASRDRRTPGRWQDIVIGVECGGSDAFSGITANPLIGRVSDYLVAGGGTTVLTEVPEMFGAEQVLMNHCINADVFAATVHMIDAYKHYYSAHGQPIYENPSPGNHAGGITTLEEKSLGCIRKAGASQIVDVVAGEGRVTRSGLNLLYSPGNDLVATTALGCSGCHLILFSTGRGTPLGGFVPTIKIASNSALAAHKPRWIDFDAGVLADPGVDHDRVLSALLEKIALVINGARTSAETRGDRQIAIFKTGVTL